MSSVADPLPEFSPAEIAAMTPSRRHYVLHREEVLERARAWARDHRKDRVQSARRWQSKNREKHLRNLKSYNRRRYEADRLDPKLMELRRASNRASYSRHRENRLKKHAEWRRLNRGRVAEMAARHRALQAAATVNLAGIKEWMHQVLLKPSALCYYCQQRTPRRKIHFDHIVPLAKGGAHSLENLCVSCATCNQRKRDKNIRAWVRMGQQVMEL